MNEAVRRIEDAPSGLANVMRKHGAVFYREGRDKYIIDVPKRTKRGTPDHRSYEQWTISKNQIELMTSDLDSGVPPLRFDAKPPIRNLRRHSLKGRSTKRVR